MPLTAVVSYLIIPKGLIVMMKTLDLKKVYERVQIGQGMGMGERMSQKVWVWVAVPLILQELRKGGVKDREDASIGHRPLSFL